MSQQMRIDQFYKVVGNKDISKRSNSIKVSNTSDSKKIGQRNIKKQNVLSSKNCRTMSSDAKNQLSKAVSIAQVTLSMNGSTETVTSTFDAKVSKETNLFSQADKNEEKEIGCQSKNEIVPSLCEQPRKTSSAPLILKRTTSPSKSSNNLPKSFKRYNKLTKLFTEGIDMELVFQAIENLNLAKQGVICPNDFDLEEIYSRYDFTLHYDRLNTSVTNKYEIEDVIVPGEKHADHLFMIITDVFTNPINCGYFNEEELDFIFSALTLSAKAQMLLARLLKRKRSWHRIKSLENAYPEITNNLEPFFKELVKLQFCKSSIEDEDMPSLLQLLQVEEIRNICQKLKVNHQGNKSKNIIELVKLATVTKSLFPGAKSPSSALREMVTTALGCCICLSTNALSIIDRIVTLFIPSLDPKMNLSDVILMLTQIYRKEMLFPLLPKERYPVFRNREHLIEYVKGKNSLSEIIEAGEKKNWETVRLLGYTAYDHLIALLQNKETRTESFAIPLHVKKFMPEYVWIKVLTKSIDAFKKSKCTIPEAVKFLRTLINQRSHVQSNRGRWYGELALIEMHHKKDLEACATLTMNALTQENLTDVDIVDLSERARKLVKRRTGISSHTKTRIQTQLQSITCNLASTPSVIIEATLVQGNAGYKSTWSVDIGKEDKGYMNVEKRALCHYHEQGFHNGVHCEGALPMMLFTVLFWKELYAVSIPGAFMSSYQTAPLDLYTLEFYKNRREQIESKIQYVRSLDSQTLSDLMDNAFTMCQQYRSLIPNGLLSNQRFKEVVLCLGTNGVIGICERLIKDFNLWKAGFPDLIVWNSTRMECKIVEVKGPGDSLSTKQKLWLQYLEGLGITTEVCIVQAKGNNQKNRY